MIDESEWGFCKVEKCQRKMCDDKNGGGGGWVCTKCQYRCKELWR